MSPTRLLATTLLSAGVHSSWDALIRPSATHRGDIPWSIEAITSEWLSAVLFPAQSSAKVTDLRTDGRSSGTSVRGRIHLQYNHAGQDLNPPKTLFCKSTPTFVTRMANGISRTMAYEANFYNQMRQEIAVEAPIGYHSAFDLRTLRSVHLLEDLVETQGAQFCNHSTEINRADAEDVVSTLASFHGHFFEDDRFQTDFSWLPSFRDWFHVGIAGANLKKFNIRGLVKGEAVIPSSLFARKESIWPAFLQALETNDRLPKTLLHSDVHLGNWYKTGTGQMGLCDWQCVSQGHWARDLAYALSTMLTIPDRRDWEEDLIRLYIGELESFGGPKVSFNEAWLWYRQNLISALLMWTPTLSPPTFMPDMQPVEISMELVKRTATAIDDLHGLDSLG